LYLVFNFLEKIENSNLYSWFKFSTTTLVLNYFKVFIYIININILYNKTNGKSQILIPKIIKVIIKLYESINQRA